MFSNDTDSNQQDETLMPNNSNVEIPYIGDFATITVSTNADGVKFSMLLIHFVKF